MTKENQNVVIRSGDTHTLTVTVDDGATPPAVVDITGATIWWWASRLSSNGKFSATATLQKDNAGTGGITITDALNGEFQVTLAPADTATLAGEFYHEAQIRDGSGNISTVLTGTLTIKRDLVTAT